MATNKNSSKQGPKTEKSNSTNSKDSEKTLTTERWVEPTENASKEDKAAKAAGDKVKPNPHNAPQADDDGTAKKIVNEQEQNNIVNQQNDTKELEADQQLNKDINSEDFPEADDSTERPFKKVPTMDA